MPHRPTRRQLLKAATQTSIALFAPAAWPQAVSAPPVIPRLEGTTSGGKPVTLAGLRGRVVLVFYWSTACPVCRDKMQELRANMAGWKDRPFTVLGVNLDPRPQDLLDYERLLASTVPAHLRFDSLRGDAPGFFDSMGRPAQLPSACLIDAQGRLVERYLGRIPPQAWDRIAELL
jgi:cytochrome oxidase Cu insertion factor (SCO1/SenC/PrrC family)